MQIKTPSLTHATSTDWENVYEPSEDTFLLIDALELDWKRILDNKPVVCLEIGSGSGAVLSALASCLGEEAFYLATDVNNRACDLTKRTGVANQVVIEAICADLSPLRDGVVDLVIFNPPYVPTSSEEVQGLGIERSWAGGKRGREVIDRFLQQVVPKLSANGLGYLLLLIENDPQEVGDILKGLDCSVEKIAQRQIRGECLIVLRFQKN